MLRLDAECSKPSALQDLLTVIKDLMLVIPLPQDTDVYQLGCRANAKYLSEKLDKIVEDAGKNRQYLFTGSDRSKSLAPMRGVEAIQKIQRESHLHLNISGGSRVGVTENRLDRYTRKMTLNWSVCEDSAFAEYAFNHYEDDHQATRVFDLAPAALCDLCSKVDLQKLATFPPRTVSEVAVRGGFESPGCCHLCIILYRCAQENGLLDDDVIRLNLGEGKLELVVGGSIRGSLRLCRAPGESQKNSSCMLTSFY